MSKKNADAKRDRLRRARRFVLELIVIAGAYFAISTCQTRRLLDSNARAPDFTLTSVDGSTTRLGDLEGKTVLVHFWATWCGVCRREFDMLSAVAKELGEDARLVSIVADGEDAASIRKFVDEHGIDYPVLLGTPEVLRAYGVDTFPTNYFLDESGRISGRTIGMSTRWALKTRIGCAK